MIRARTDRVSLEVKTLEVILTGMHYGTSGSPQVR